MRADGRQGVPPAARGAGGKILAQGVSPEYPNSMTAAWQISVAKLRKQSPQALELLRCCAFLGPEPIPREVFKLGPQESNTGVGALMADPIHLSTAISVLGRFALVKMDGPYLTVHRLIQALLRADLEPDKQSRYRQDAHSILAVGAPGNPTDPKTWLRYRDLVAHVGSTATDLAHCQMDDHRRFALEVVRYSTRLATSRPAGCSPNGSSSSGPRIQAPLTLTYLTPTATSATHSGNSGRRQRLTRSSRPR